MKKLILSLILILNLAAQNDSTICFTVEQSEQLLNDVNKSVYYEQLSNKQDSLINSMRVAGSEFQTLVNMQDTQIRTLKETRLHYKKMWVKAERSRQNIKITLTSGILAVGTGLLLRDEKIGAIAGVGAYCILKFKLLEIEL